MKKVAMLVPTMIDWEEVDIGSDILGVCRGVFGEIAGFSKVRNGRCFEKLVGLNNRRFGSGGSHCPEAR